MLLLNQSLMRINKIFNGKKSDTIQSEPDPLGAAAGLFGRQPDPPISTDSGVMNAGDTAMPLTDALAAQ